MIGIESNGTFETLNIYYKMLKITEDINIVAKNLEVGYGKSKYKAVSEADVLAAVKPIEIKHGVYSYPVDREIIDSHEITAIKTAYDGSTEEKISLYMRIKTVYRFVNTSNPQEYIDIVTYGDGVDAMDKAPGKAMTYSDKYALLKAYKIQTGDDSDQEASGKIIKSSSIKKDEEPIQVEKFSDLDFDLTCENCGGVILPHTTHTAVEIAEKSKKQFGQQLCWDCAKEARAAAK